MIPQESLTNLEPFHLEQGVNYLVRSNFDSVEEYPSLIGQITALPLVIAGVKDASQLPPQGVIYQSRLVVVMFGAMILIVCYWLTRYFFSGRAALLATTFLLFNPTFLSHSHYVSTDIGATMFFLVAWVMFLAFVKQPTWIRSLILGVVVGAVAAANMLALLFLLISIIMFIFFSLPARIFSGLKHYGKGSIVIVVVALLVLWGSFHFQMTPFPLRQYGNHLVSTFQHIQDDRLDYVNGSYRLGQWHDVIEIYLIKTPLPELILLFTTGLYFLVTVSQKATRQILKRIYLPAVIVFSVSLLLNTPPMVRYLLFASPFLAVSSGIVLDKLFLATVGKLVTLLMVLWMIGSTLLVMPHPLIFHNQFVADGLTTLTDSNLDWGQGLIRLAKYLKINRLNGILLSYSGKDDARRYGFINLIPNDVKIQDDKCALHMIGDTSDPEKAAIIISTTNWQQCGYMNQSIFQTSKIQTVISGMFLVFPYEKF